MNASKPVAVEEIGIDADGHLFVRPALGSSENFESVWRDGSGVRWNEKLRALHAAEPARSDHFELYKQTLTTVRNEYGKHLVFTSGTRWPQVPSDLEKLIQGWQVKT